MAVRNSQMMRLGLQELIPRPGVELLLEFIHTIAQGKIVMPINIF